MFDLKISVIVIADIFIYLAGILFWFSLSFANALGVIGFGSRFFAGLVAVIIGIIITFIIVRYG